MNTKKIRILGFAASLIFVFAAGESFGVREGEKMVDVDSGMENRLFGKRIFFGHQSVGDNILAGIKELHPHAADHIVDIKDSPRSRYPEAGLLHARVGSNRNPKSKIDEFRKIIEAEFDGDLDVAFIKLCYVDFNSETDVNDLFAYYKSQMDFLKSRYPDITFVHVTAPLTVNNETLKTRIKKLTGIGEIWEYQGNIKRNLYNRLLLDEYKGKEPVFDIAEVESTRSAGERESFSFNGQNYFSLVKDLSSDGGHLNDDGSKRVASSLLSLMAGLQK
jgi:hypothetical protein